MVVTTCNEMFLSNEIFECVVDVQCSCDCLCLHYHGLTWVPWPDTVFIPSIYPRSLVFCCWDRPLGKQWAESGAALSQYMLQPRMLTVFVCSSLCCFDSCGSNVYGTDLPVLIGFLMFLSVKNLSYFYV